MPYGYAFQLTCLPEPPALRPSRGQQSATPGGTLATADPSYWKVSHFPSRITPTLMPETCPAVSIR